MPRKSNTRAASGSGTIRQRPDGTWEARFVVGHDPGTGKPIRKSVYGKTQAEVRKKMTATQRAIDNGTYQAPDKTTVSQWLDTWMETFCAVKVKPLTFSSYAVAIKNHIKPSLGALRLQAVKGIHVQKLYNSMTAAGLSAKTVKNVAAILHKAFSVAVKQGIMQANPCDAAELPKAAHKEITPLTDAEIPLFLEAIKGRSTIRVGGLITSIRNGMSKAGNPYGIFTLEDYEGPHEFALFGKNYVEFGKYMIPNYHVCVSGIVQPKGADFKYRREEQPGLPKEWEFKIQHIDELGEIKAKFLHSIVLSVSLQMLSSDFVERLSHLVKGHKGNTNLYVEVLDSDSNDRITLFSRQHRLEMNKDLYRLLKDAKHDGTLLGIEVK